MNKFFSLYLNAFNNYANFSGRACRAEAIAFLLTNFLIGAIAGYAAKAQPELGLILMDAFGIYGLIILIPSIALTARRLHDTNHSGWIQLFQLFGTMPLVGIVIEIAFIIVLFVLPGDEGENKYGSVPSML